MVKTKKTISTYYAKNDKELPYVFDLFFDIKTLGQLYYSLAVKDDSIYSIKELEEIMMENNIIEKDFLELNFTDEFKKNYVSIFENNCHFF